MLFILHSAADDSLGDVLWTESRDGVLLFVGSVKISIWDVSAGNHPELNQRLGLSRRREGGCGRYCVCVFLGSVL